jgi:hypothetical protein
MPLALGKVIESAEEQCTEVVRTRAGDRLCTNCTALCNGRRIRSENELRSGSSVLGQTQNGQVFVVERFVIEKLLSSLLMFL